MTTNKKKVSLSDTHIKKDVNKPKGTFTNIRKTAPEGRRITGIMTKHLNETNDDAFKFWLQGKIEKEDKLRRQRQEEEQAKIKLEQEKQRKKEEAAEAANENRKAWLRRKAAERNRKELEKKQLLAQEELKRKEREAVCQQRVRLWMEAAKYKPKPTRNNMGLASLMCNNVCPMNRIPWKNIIECGAD